MKKIILMLMLVLSVSCFSYQFDNDEIYGFKRIATIESGDSGVKYDIETYSSIDNDDFVKVVHRTGEIVDFSKDKIRKFRENGFIVEINQFSNSKVSYTVIKESPKGRLFDERYTAVYTLYKNVTTMEFFEANVFSNEMPVNKNTDSFLK